MDIFSAAARLRRPFEINAANRDAPYPIAAHGLIGDGSSAALVRVDGAIDWLCWPNFDSPSVFASLLDPQRGGITYLRPTAPQFESLQQYDPETNVLETLFRVPDQGLVRLTDYMPWTDDPRQSIHEVHRRVDCREGAVELEAVFDPRFSYGGERAEISFEEHGVVARAGNGDALVAVLGGDGAHWEPRPEGGARSNVRLRAGERCWMVMSWGSTQPEPLAAYRPFEQLRATRHFWRKWARQLEYDGPWRHHVLRAALVLKLLIYARTGAMVAAPTTSLPEWVGGQRNWDYRYTWTRDTAMAIRAANLIGYEREARDFFHFVRDTLDTGDGLRVMYRINGEQVPGETILEHLAGHQDSRPVRIGNGAREQVQLDTAGGLLDAAYLHEHFKGTLTLRTWRHLRRLVDDVQSRWRDADHGIWEVRGPMQHHLHSKLMSWVALDRACRLAPLFGGERATTGWAREASALREDIEKAGLDPGRTHFVKHYGGDEMDATLLLLPIHGFLDVRDPRVERTIARVRAELGEGPFLHRYLDDDGVGGQEGAFLLCGFWLAETLALAGKLEEAQEVFFAHVETSNHVGLLSEEINPYSGELLGNFPQAFSHLGLINAAWRIDKGLRLRDEGSARSPRLFLYDAT
jgi:GH15 family glucan-1,4-alpha-glucosidase